MCTARQHVLQPSDTSAPANHALMILDGGMGHQLKAMGVEISGPVGSMRRFLGVACANLERPEMVRDAHLSYIDAGAQIITTNNYACVPKCLEHAAMTELGQEIRRDGIGKIIAGAGKQARAACQLRPDRKVMVAGGLPPLAESYRPDRVGSFDDNVADYLLIAKSIAPYSDVLLCETMSTADEARAAVTAAATTGLPIWVAWTLDENTPVLRSGESIQVAVDAIKSVPGANVQACLFNCTSPEICNIAMPILRDLVPGMRIGAYANGFMTAANGVGEYRDLSPEEYDEFAGSGSRPVRALLAVVVEYSHGILHTCRNACGVQKPSYKTASNSISISSFGAFNDGLS
jgi:S-methylmethionine-dependent homocysteine/selenocysteine methylase